MIDKELIGLYRKRIKTLDEDDTQNTYNHERNHRIFGITPQEFNKKHSHKDNKLQMLFQSFRMDSRE